jgi:membrane protease YdiL (CAAX protease family)
MVASQLVRLGQTDVMVWLFWDYAGRLGALVVLAVMPSARRVAFRREESPSPPWILTLTIIVGLVLIEYLFDERLRSMIDMAIPATRLGHYPVLQGPLRAFDIVVGLALVAYHEEIVFRRVARRAFQPWLGDGAETVIVTSLLFAAYHWWSGIGNITMVFLLGIALMLAYRRLNALWPVVIAHYLMDFVAFI